MKFSEEFRDQSLVRDLARRLALLGGRPATLMEVCGTHTMSVTRFGLQSLLPRPVRLVSGPGCPVCVTAPRDLDAFLALGSLPGLILATFGDMLKAPGSATSLERVRAAGADVRVVYSPLDAVDLARQDPRRQVVFFGVGFETTMPATALAVKTAAAAGLGNFTVFTVHKTMPPALRALLAGGEAALSGLLLPGHVTTIIGAQAYDFIPAEFHLPCAVAGFEPLDILLGVEAILRQLQEGVARVDNVYTRAVASAPNPRAEALLAEVFTPAAARWRGLGDIPASGVEIRGPYAAYDARRRFREVIASVPEPGPSACRCGEVLRGVLAPSQCPLFGAACDPAQPLGPCMVSQEGACAAAFRYARQE
ncbi:MAG: hydrogenase formation protein HypD [Deltaproteobacteria bacterium]|nr:hydrogenase formation protein HypD [Deltaproteobacteria bacterium]